MTFGGGVPTKTRFLKESIPSQYIQIMQLAAKLHLHVHTQNRPKLGLVLHVYHTVSPPQGFTRKSKCTGLIENKREMLHVHGCIQHLHIASGICLYIYLCAYKFFNLFRGLQAYGAFSEVCFRKLS